MAQLLARVILFSLFIAFIAATGAEASAQQPVKQSILCQLDFCPEFLSEEGWNKRTVECCGQGSNLTFLHAQWKKAGSSDCIFACLPVLTCAPGTIPVIHEYNEDKNRYANLKCEPCEQDKFQAKPTVSYKYRLRTCLDTHQSCSREGKITVTNGNATHDTTCRCLWENGFAPNPNTSLCASPNGFKGNDYCSCQKHQCDDGMVLNNEYKCGSPPSTTPEPQSSTPKMDKTEPVTPKPPASERPNGWEKYGWKIYLTGFVAVLVAAAIFIMCKFHP